MIRDYAVVAYVVTSPEHDIVANLYKRLHCVVLEDEAILTYGTRKNRGFC